MMSWDETVGFPSIEHAPAVTPQNVHAYTVRKAHFDMVDSVAAELRCANAKLPTQRATPGPAWLWACRAGVRPLPDLAFPRGAVGVLGGIDTARCGRACWRWSPRPTCGS